MKKFFLFSIVAALLLSSCGNKHKAAVLNNEADSISYMFGYFYGFTNLKHIQKIDSAKTDEFIQGVKKGLKTKELSKNEITAQSFAFFIYTQYCSNGFIIGDSSLVANFETIKQGVYDALDNVEYSMELDSTLVYLNKIMKKSMQKEAVTPGELDTMNYIIGYANIKSALDRDLLEKDPKEIKKFKETYDKIDQNNCIKYLGILSAYEFAQNACNETLFNINTPCNIDLIKAGFIDGIEKVTLTTDPEKCSQYLQDVNTKRVLAEQAKEAEEAKVLFADNLENGQKFLEENKQRKEVTTTESGLQYEIIKQGKGKIPTAEDKVKVHYHGTLIDGTVFDSSVDRGEPVVFGVNQVIPGWVEALQLMPVGSKWKLYIPYDLAYGEHGAGELISPYSTLIFEVELIDIENPDKK